MGEEGWSVQRRMNQKRNKYGNRKTVVDNITFDSAKEARKWKELRILEKAGEIEGLKRQVEYPLTVNDIRIAKYRCDFQYFDKHGVEHVLDVKGYETREWKIKRLLMYAVHGIKVETA